MAETVVPVPVATQALSMAQTPLISSSSTSTPALDPKAEEKAAKLQELREHLLKETDSLVIRLVSRPNDKGVLIPLKTTNELDDDHIAVDAFITRVPTKCANAAVSLLTNILPKEVNESLPHLRRCAKPSDLAPHLKTTFMNDVPGGRQMHTGKSPWVYVLVGLVDDIDRRFLVESIAKLDDIGDHVFLAKIPVPLLQPSSQMQAAMWSQNFWPTIYRKNNPLGPHPSMVSRATEEITHDTSKWMKLAFRIARAGHKARLGEPMGAVIVQREGEKTIVVSAAADARHRSSCGLPNNGNPMSHCSLRAISMVAQKLVRAEKHKNYKAPDPTGLAFDALHDLPLLPEEEAIYKMDHPTPDGYLCHGLELYMTHEPCIMCSMAILHSRMGKIVFANRMPLTGGMCAETRRHEKEKYRKFGGGKGLGLFWRRELNWSLLAWEWESCKSVKPLPAVDPTAHG